jgi:hypothetical protein
LLAILMWLALISSGSFRYFKSNSFQRGTTVFHNIPTFICITAIGLFAIGGQKQTEPTASKAVTTAAHDAMAGHQHDSDAHEVHGEAEG